MDAGTILGVKREGWRIAGGSTLRLVAAATIHAHAETVAVVVSYLNNRQAEAKCPILLIVATCL